MGMGISAGKKGRKRGRAGGGPISEINVTPMVDVMLVLLIVFMVAAPLMTMGVPVDLPKTQAQAMPLERKPITVTVTNAGAISIDGDPATMETLVPMVEALAVDGTDERLYARRCGDRLWADHGSDGRAFGRRIWPDRPDHGTQRGRIMRLALPGSALIHVGFLALILIGLPRGEAEDAPAPAPVSVSIVAMSSVSSNESVVVESDATVSSVSAGSDVEVLEPVEPEALEEIVEAIEAVTPEEIVQENSETAEPVAVETVEEAVVEAVEADIVEAEPIAEDVSEPLEAEPVETLVAEPLQSELTTSDENSTLEAIQPEAMAVAETEAIEPVAVEDFKAAPVPVMATIRRQAEPIVHKPRPPQTQEAQRPPPQQRGNGGNANSDNVAAAGGAPPQASGNGNGGAAEEARYQSQVTRKVRNALRGLRGQSGLVVVGFTVHADGRVSGIGVVQSSGNAAIDQAGVDAVQRAAPFPPFPGGVNRSSWPFGVPLEYKR
jgi:TonB family protein